MTWRGAPRTGGSLSLGQSQGGPGHPWPGSARPRDPPAASAAHPAAPCCPDGVGVALDSACPGRAPVGPYAGTCTPSCRLLIPVRSAVVLRCYGGRSGRGGVTLLGRGCGWESAPLPRPSLLRSSGGLVPPLVPGWGGECKELLSPGRGRTVDVELVPCSWPMGWLS